MTVLSVNPSRFVVRLASGDLTDGTVAEIKTLADLEDEDIEDIAGPLAATGGTKTGITVTYQDSTGDMDFVVDDPQIKTGSFTRAGDAATGTQAITGAGFQPVGLWIMWYNSTDFIHGGIGFTDGTNDYGRNVSGGVNHITTNIVDFNHDFASTDMQRATLSSFDSDGFTLSWTKTGSPPAETMECRYWAIGDWS